MPPIQGDILVKSDNPYAYIIKIGARIYVPYDKIQGLAFEFSDGSKINLSAHGGGNTDPYDSYESSVLQTVWLSVPDGFDEIKWSANNSNCGHTLNGIYLYRKKTLVAQFSPSGWCCNFEKRLNVDDGKNISSIRMNITCDYYQSFDITNVYGVMDPNAKSVDGNWSDWSDWSLCSEGCGPGLKQRTRKCDNPSPYMGGKECEGDEIEYAPCNIIECPVDGNWGEWGEWGECTGDCGNEHGIKYRTRQCNNPYPSAGGKDCVGNSKEALPCIMTTCPVHGGWGDWGAWSKCSTECGEGEMKRIRKCDNHVPAKNGDYCTGPSEEVKSCVGNDCPKPIILNQTHTVVDVKPKQQIEHNNVSNNVSNIVSNPQTENQNYDESNIKFMLFMFFIFIVLGLISVNTDIFGLSNTDRPIVEKAIM